MKKLILIAALAVAGWYAYQWLQKMSTEEKIKHSAPVQYVNGLQQDVRRAKAAEEQANRIIRNTSKQVKDLVDQAEKP